MGTGYSVQDRDEGNTNDLTLQELQKYMDELKAIALQIHPGIQIPNNPLSEGSANQIPNPQISSPEPELYQSPSANMDSYLLEVAGQPDFLPDPSTGISQPTGKGTVPGIAGMAGMFNNPISGTQEVVFEKEEEEVPTGNVWNQILEVLQEAAAAEMAGVVIYSFYAEVLNGVEGKILSSVFKDAATESATHYSQVINWMLRVQGGRAYVSPHPCSREMQDIPFIANLSTPDYCKKLCQIAIERAMEHESKAVEIYCKLYCLVKGGIDTPLENWVMNQIQTENQDLVEFGQWSGKL
jgi:rubrerythrin